MHIAQKAGHLVKDLASSASADVFGKREFCVYLSNGTDEALAWIDSDPIAGCSCSRSFGSQIEPGHAGSMRFRDAGDLAAEVLLQLRDHWIYITVRKPILGSAGVIIQSAKVQERRRTSRRRSLRVVSNGAAKVPSGSLNVGHIQGSQLTYYVRVDGKGTGNVAHVFLGRITDIAKDPKGSAKLSGRFAPEGLTSRQLLDLVEWCTKFAPGSLSGAVFLLEYAAVLRGLDALVPKDKAYMMDLLVEAFLTNGLLYNSNALLVGVLDAETKRWESSLPPELTGNFGYEEFTKSIADDESLPQHIDAAIALLKTAALLCSIALQQKISVWLAAIGTKDFAITSSSGQTQPAERPPPEAEGNCSVLHRHLTDEAQDDGASIATSRGDGATSVLITLVRQCISVSADFTLRNREVLDKLCENWPRNTSDVPMKRYRAWVPAARRDLELKAPEEILETPAKPRCCGAFGPPKMSELAVALRASTSTLACAAIGAELFAGLDDGKATSPELLLQSLGEESMPYKTMATNSKSGEFFFFSGDRRFIVKTISKSEGELLHRMLPGYQAHLRMGRSLIVRYGGLYRMEIPGIGPTYFSVMTSVFDPAFPIHETFDLKGSMQGRRKRDGEKIGKDEDWVKQNKRLLINNRVRCELTAAHERDAAFLQNAGVMDYSLLIGIHNLTDGAGHACGFWETGTGVWADGAPVCYFVGLIDFLISFGLGKKGEHIIRAVQGHAEDTSCVDPVSYARRQVHFVREKVVARACDGAPLGTHGTLRVTVRSAEALKKADVLGDSDPYVCAGVGMQRLRTHTVMNNCNPQWNCTICLGVNEAHLPGNLELSVWDEDEKAFQGMDDFLGKMSIPVHLLMKVGTLEVSKDLEGVVHGRLNLRVEMISAPCTLPGAAPPSPDLPACPPPPPWPMTLGPPCVCS